MVKKLASLGEMFAYSVGGRMNHGVVLSAILTSIHILSFYFLLLSSLGLLYWC